MLPSYFSYKLTGIKSHEYSNESTTSLLNANSGDYDKELLEKLGMPLKLFNIIEKPEFQIGVDLAKAYLEKYPNNYLKIIIGGGDGTVLSIVRAMKNNGISLDKLYFGPMPCGTGNDLSNSLGFGNTLSLGGKVTTLNRVLYTYLSATNTKIDIWDFEVSLGENGSIREVTKTGEQIMMNKETNTPMKEFKANFINYSSIGFDARVGFDFEQNRGTSACCNKCIYAWEGFKRVCCCCCKTTVKMSNILDKFYK